MPTAIGGKYNFQYLPAGDDGAAARLSTTLVMELADETMPNLRSYYA